jgi:hypothetical protein
MNLPGDWPLLAGAGVAAAVAVVGGDYLPVSLPAGAAAVALAALLFLAPAGTMARDPPAGPRLGAPTTTSTVRAAFRAGRAGRATIVAELDRVERRVANPNLPARSIEEDATIRAMDPAAFRAYVAERLRGIEQGGAA